LGDVTVSGAMKKVPLELLEDVTEGDTVLLCDGVAIARASASQITEGGNHVLGNTR
jgi:hydrogenase maturation factor